MLSPADRLRAELSQIYIEVRSPRGYIQLHRSAAGTVELRVRPGTLAALPSTRLAAEIRALLAEALATFDREYFAARRRVYGSDMGLGLDETSHA